MKEKEEGEAEDELNSITDSVDMNVSKLLETVEDQGAWCAAVPGGGKESDTTERLTHKHEFTVGGQVLELQHQSFQ